MDNLKRYIQDLLTDYRGCGDCKNNICYGCEGSSMFDPTEEYIVEKLEELMEVLKEEG